MTVGTKSFPLRFDFFFYLCTMIINEVIAFLDSRFHPEYQEDYDNAGFLVGDGGTAYTGSLVALDLTPAVADEAIAYGLNLIVTHHPLIFRGVRRITDATETGRTLLKLIRAGVAVYAAHTNLDNMPDGVNGILADKLGLQHCSILAPKHDAPQHTPTTIGAGMVGTLPAPMEPEAFLMCVKEVLGLPVVRHSGLAGLSCGKVGRVAICGGSGSDFIDDALRAGAEVYLTADLKYHDFQRTGGRMLLADIGHYESEQFAKEIIYRAISEKFCNFACRISECQQGVVHYI